ncbi:MAG: acyltransferase [Burkholderiaceae bacterium]|nr:acyltransferase [Burkholderiaceae bacterium]
MKNAALAIGRHERLESLQVLRGVAAMLVVYNHVGDAVRTAAERVGSSLLAPSADLVKLGEVGVDLFFVISGFVMTLSARRFSGWTGSATFLAARFNRIAPLYYLVTLVMLANLLRAGASDELTAESYLNSLTFIPIFDDSTYSWPIHFLGWTLAFEFTFYVFVALQIAARLGTRAIVLLAAVAVLPLLHPLTQNADMAWQMATSPLLWEFALGILCYMLWERGLLNRIPRRLLGALALLAAGVLVAQATAPGHSLSFLAYDPVNYGDLHTRAWAFGIPCFVITCFVVTRRVGGSPAALLGRSLGDASYSLYLTHVLVVSVLAKAMELLWLPADVYVVGGLVASALVALAVYRWVEKPLLEAGQRRLRTWLPALRGGTGSVVAVARVHAGTDRPRRS